MRACVLAAKPLRSQTVRPRGKKIQFDSTKFFSPFYNPSRDNKRTRGMKQSSAINLASWAASSPLENRERLSEPRGMAPGIKKRELHLTVCATEASPQVFSKCA